MYSGEHGWWSQCSELVIIDVVEEAVELMADDAYVFLALLADCEVAALAVDDADFALLALETGVLEPELLLLRGLGDAFEEALPLAHLVGLPLEDFPLDLVVGGLLLLLQLLLELLLLPERDVLRVHPLLFHRRRQLRGVDLEEVQLVLHADHQGLVKCFAGL